MKTFLCMTLLAAGMTFAQTPANQPPPKEAKDPVCGMTVDPKSSDTQKTEYKGKVYYFCSKEDKAKFDKAPAGYAAKSDANAKK